MRAKLERLAARMLKARKPGRHARTAEPATVIFLMQDTFTGLYS